MTIRLDLFELSHHNQIVYRLTDGRWTVYHCISSSGLWPVELKMIFLCTHVKRMRIWLSTEIH